MTKLGDPGFFRRTRRRLIISIWRASGAPLSALLFIAAAMDPCLRGRGPLAF